ncbi:hypothetical protein BGAL_0252g00180 [Botrytis galanthina]|uniref:Uncharacterized protein n=1 Tax=Botrytis galanthina TaxID=278940 RepID=A0A4V4HU82_9HELO|nr:hypothetical protein BGAL_0252g00180 [Botrytis galanthina]
MSSPVPNRQHKLGQGERSAKPSASESHPRESSQSTKDYDHTRSPGYTDNVTSQHASAKVGSRPRLPRPQSRSGSETFSPLEAPKLQKETVYSSDQGIPNKIAQLAVTSNSRIGSEVSNHSRGVPNHLNNSPHHPSDTQTPRSQTEHPTHVYSDRRRWMDAQLHPNLRRGVPLCLGPFQSGNAQAPPQPQRGAPGYSNPIPQRPSNFQGQPAQQEQFHEGRRRDQPNSPQLVAAPANSKSLPQELNASKRNNIESQRRERPAPVTSDSEDTAGQERSPSPLQFKDRRYTSSKDGKKPKKEHKKRPSYVRSPQSSLFKSSRMDQKSTEKSQTRPGETTLGGFWVRESGITRRGTKNSEAWKPGCNFLGFSWASGDKYVTRRLSKKS